MSNVPTHDDAFLVKDWLLKHTAAAEDSGIVRALDRIMQHALAQQNVPSLDRAVIEVIMNADVNVHIRKRSMVARVAEEVAELVAALAGEHEHTPAHEWAQIGGIAINALRQIYRC